MARPKKESKDKEKEQQNTTDNLESVFIASIAKEVGENIFGGDEANIDIDRMPLGIPSLDYAFGGGVPRGRIIEIFGPESSGKTTLSLTIIKRDQETNPNSRTLYIDVEQGLDFKYMFDEDKLHLNKSKVRIVQPDDLKAACQIFGMAAASGLYSVIVFDSTAAKAKEEDVETNYTGNDKAQSAEARILSQCLSKSVGAINKHDTIAILCSQVRASMKMYGSPEVTTGGNAPKFYASVRIETRRKEQMKDGDEIIANLTRCKFVKNKVAPPYKEVELKLEFGTGFNQGYDIGMFAEHLGILTKKGAWYSYNDENIAQGINDLSLLVAQNEELKDKLLQDIYAQLGYA